MIVEIIIVVGTYLIGKAVEYFFPGVNAYTAIRQCVEKVTAKTFTETNPTNIEKALRKGHCLAVKLLYEDTGDIQFRQHAQSNQFYRELGNAYQDYLQHKDCTFPSSSPGSVFKTELLASSLSNECRLTHHVWFFNLDTAKIFSVITIFLAVSFVAWKIRRDAYRTIKPQTLDKIPVSDEESYAKRINDLFTEAERLKVTFENAPEDLCRNRTLARSPVKFPSIKSDTWFDETWIQQWYQEQREAKVSLKDMKLPIAGNFRLGTKNGMRLLERDYDITFKLQAYLQEQIRLKKLKQQNNPSETLESKGAESSTTTHNDTQKAHSSGLRKRFIT